MGWLRGRGVAICGIEITPDAAPVQSHPFRGPTAFLAGSEGEGLCDAHKALCDHFVYVPHYGTGTASLNVTVATSIVLHHFGVWAGYAEAPRQAGRDKFVVAALPAKRGPEGECDADTQDARRRAREEAEAAGQVAGFAEASDDGGGEWEGTPQRHWRAESTSPGPNDLGWPMFCRFQKI